MKIRPLASGSSGNCTLIDSGKTKILIDAGISARKISQSLKSTGMDMDEIDAVVVTHEHSDHIRALPAMRVPVYVSSETRHLWEGLLTSLRQFHSGEAFRIGDMHLTPFPVPHDALDPVGFTIEHRDKKLGIATDIGSITETVLDKLQGCDMLILESNHDEELLMSGNYPLWLKERVRGDRGHLSNRQCSQLLENLVHSKLRFVVLAHLSEQNNRPDLALAAAHKAIGNFPTSLHAAPKNNSEEVFAL